MPSGRPRRVPLGRTRLKAHQRGASPLAGPAFRDTSALLGVRNWGGRSRKAASALRLRHLAQTCQDSAGADGSRVPVDSCGEHGRSLSPEPTPALALSGPHQV
ncbi:hypothetical protein NDU88_007129 [Pleurodeles waltl]|uniref:Uncharacterized protein n=1 Tax=Pleurodeles waltl TaxID=8319 RepID=A0AAV7N185_PLEWA|nr:hypothetical protein NDU88_007129 [Pleurodeles waltl]